MKTTIFILLGVITLFLISSCATNSSHEGIHDKVMEHEAHGTLDFSAEYNTDPSPIVAGEQTKITFALTDESGNPLSDLIVHHGRKVHTIIISKDLYTIGHIHPMDFGEDTAENEQQGLYPVYYTFPKRGTYLMAINIMSIQGEGNKQFVISTAGESEMSAAELDHEKIKFIKGFPIGDDDILADPISMSAQEGDSEESYKVEFSAPKMIKAGEEVLLTYMFTKKGNTVKEFVPYLDAPMHVAVVKEDLSTFIHTHGGPLDWIQHTADDHKGHNDGHDVPKLFGPELGVLITFPEPGTYAVFGQIKHQDELIVSRFTVEVE